MTDPIYGNPSCVPVKIKKNLIDVSFQFAAMSETPSSYPTKQWENIKPHIASLEEYKTEYQVSYIF